MTSIKLPTSIEAASEQLADLSALISSKEWARAAVVYAFTRNDGAGRPLKLPNTRQLTVLQFSLLKINGLASRETVRLYREAWEYAIDQGAAEPVEPGDKVTLPNILWPVPPKNERTMEKTDPKRLASIRTAASKFGVSANTVVQVVNTPAAIEAAIHGDPRTWQLARSAVDTVGFHDYTHRPYDPPRSSVQGFGEPGGVQSTPPKVVNKDIPALVQSLTPAQKAEVVKAAMADPVVVREVVNDDTARRAVGQAHIARATDIAAANQARRTPEQRENLASLSDARAWTNTEGHGLEALIQGKAFVAELVGYEHTEERDAVVEHVVASLRMLADHAEGWLSGQSGRSIEDELADLTAGGI